MKKTLLIPGPSAVGRDFLLDLLLQFPHEIGATLDLGRPITMGVAKKTTDRVSRKTETLKECIPPDEFSSELAQNKILAVYTLESNGCRYGYRPDAFESDDVDILIGDASVYQLPELKNVLGNDVTIFGMIGSRENREKKLRGRKTETEEEIIKRLNLGDAHVALLLLMQDKENTEVLSDFVHEDLANDIHQFLSLAKKIETFCGSQNVPRLIIEVSTTNNAILDGMLIQDETTLIAPDEPHKEKTVLFGQGVEALKKALLE